MNSQLRSEASRLSNLKRSPMAGVDPQEVLDMYLSHGSIAAAKHFGCSGPTIYSYVKKAGGSVRPPGHNRKSGLGSMDAQGYRVVTVGPEWPYQSMVRKGKIVPEHRKVMAESLGRPLLPSETVHHIDGNKVNNRLENLQLRQGRHGNGVVVECHDCGSRNVSYVSIGPAAN